MIFPWMDGWLSARANPASVKTTNATSSDLIDIIKTLRQFKREV